MTEPTLSSLYKYKGRYTLIVEQGIERDNWSILTAIISEYGEYVIGGLLADSMIREYGEVIVREDAIENLSRAYSE